MIVGLHDQETFKNYLYIYIYIIYTFIIPTKHVQKNSSVIFNHQVNDGSFMDFLV